MLAGSGSVPAHVCNEYIRAARESDPVSEALGHICELRVVRTGWNTEHG